MEIKEFYSTEDKEYWLNQIKKSDWDALREFADRHIRETALAWFHSKNADERETAIVERLFAGDRQPFELEDEA